MSEETVVGQDRCDTPVLSWSVITDYFPNVQPSTYLKPLPEYGVVYVKNPKAACSTLLLWLDRIHTGDPDFTPKNIHKETRLPTIADVGRRRVVRMLSGAAYRFTFVRDPRSRIESAYWDKMVRSPQWGRRALARLPLEVPEGSTPTFEQFLDAVERQDPLTDMDPHWRPQHLNLLHPYVTFDRVGHLESFQSDLDRICEESGLPLLPAEPRNRSQRRKTRSVYDGRPGLLRRVEELYATDMELYGY